MAVMKGFREFLIFCLLFCNCICSEITTLSPSSNEHMHVNFDSTESVSKKSESTETSTSIVTTEATTLGQSEKSITGHTSTPIPETSPIVIAETSSGDALLETFPHAKHESMPTSNVITTTVSSIDSKTTELPHSESLDHSEVEYSAKKPSVAAEMPSTFSAETTTILNADELRMEHRSEIEHVKIVEADDVPSTTMNIPGNTETSMNQDSEFTTITVASTEMLPTDNSSEAASNPMEDHSNHDSNTLNNSLFEMSSTTISSMSESSTLSFLPEDSRRQEKRLNNEDSHPCPCDEPKMNLDLNGCMGDRTLPEPNCPCRRVCARQSRETCNESMPCDQEFGLQCNHESATCQGQLSAEVFDVTHDSAKIKWGSDKSEVNSQATVSYTTAFRGVHTQWTDIEPSKPVTVLSNLMPNMHYFVKIDEDGKQEVVIFQTKDDVMNHPPKILVTQIGPSSLTVVWDDFRLPSHHSEYVLEYREANTSDDSWMKVEAGSHPVVTVTQLKPNTAYDVRVAVWEDGDRKLEVPSEVVTVNTKDGCVRNNKTYGVGDEFFHACDFRCVCQAGNRETCSPRCNTPYIKIGTMPNDPLCYEKPLPSDPCCVVVTCAEAKSLDTSKGSEQEHKSGECPEIVEKSLSLEKSCLSDCDHDGDCSGTMKCCPSSCGGAICVLPIIVKSLCENIYCGPNAKCIAEKMTCECTEGFEGDAHDFINGCKPIDSMKSNSSLDITSKMLHEETTTTTAPKTMVTDGNDLEDSGHDNHHPAATTEAPFVLDLASKSEDSTEPSTFDNEDPVSEDEMKYSSFGKPHHTFNDTDGRSHPSGKSEIEDEEILNTTGEEEMLKKDKKKLPTDGPMLFDGCEYNNITYDRGVRFEDGCEARCICDRPGHVSCVPRCSVLSAGGKNCKEVPDPDDSCCKIMVCSFPGTGEEENVNELSLKILSAQPQNGTAVRIRLALLPSQVPTMVGQDSLEVWFVMATGEQDNLSQWNKRPVMLQELDEVQQGVFEFDVGNLIPDSDYFIKVAKERQGSSKLHMAEFSNTVSAKTFPSAVKIAFQGCFHHNQSYNLGEVFYQGCEFKCICRENGFIECQDRCEIYIDTVGYEGCDWIPSEEDPCCMIPSCQRRKIPLLPGSRLPPFVGPIENMCVVNSNEFYRVGDIWELDDGCKTKICRCSLLPNGTTTIQCQSECPALPPNAHIPTARCPTPVLVKPDGPCSCPYISCNEPPRRVVQPPRPQCEFKGKRYDIGHEFHDGCIALCHCSQDLRVSCAAIECPYHFSSEFTNCLEWDIDADFFPTPPQCCAPSKCKNDGSCNFSGRKFDNFMDIPAELLPCGARCVCVNGNVTCENRCPSVEDVPPPNLPCPLSLAFKGHPAGETCCLHWMCKEPPKQAYCLFQGSRYSLAEQWEVGKGSSRRHCSCHVGANGGTPQVECKGGCPQIPQRFLLPSEQCARPVIVTPDDPVMCPYVVCNNTVTAQELYNVNVVALNSTAVRIRFTLASIMVGLVGHAELYFTSDPTLPTSEWHIQKFSRPKRLFDSPNIEYILNALRPNTTYFLQVKIKIDALQGGPESELFKLKMPEEVQVISTTTMPPIVMLDAKPEAHLIDANTARISWRNFDSPEKKYIYAVQLKYKKENEPDDKWITTPMIHRDVTSYFLHDLEPSALYTVDMIFTPPKDMPTKLISAKSLEFETMGKTKDDYNLHVSVDENMMNPDSTEFSLTGIPEPITNYVHVVKILYKTADGKQSYTFKLPNNNKLQLDHLEPGRKYLAQMELYLTNGRTLTSNEVEFITKPAKSAVQSAEDNTIGGSRTNGKLAEPLQSKEVKDDENRAYFIALVVVAVVAAVAGFGFILLLVILVKRQASAKAPISRTPSESAYDNPTYKTYDGERLEDKANGQTMQTTQA